MPKEALNALRKIQYNRNDLLKHPVLTVSKSVLFEFQMPTQTKLRHSWNSGVQKAFSELDQAPQAMWDLGARGANSAKDFIKEQMK